MIKSVTRPWMRHPYGHLYGQVHRTPFQRESSTSAGQPKEDPVHRLYDGLLHRQRLALAKSITLGMYLRLFSLPSGSTTFMTLRPSVESSRQDHKVMSQSLLSKILQHTEAQTPTSFRIGLSGAPGVGKSSFIETFGMFLIGRGHRVAVLAVDPSSSRTGGSILGMYSVGAPFDPQKVSWLMRVT